MQSKNVRVRKNFLNGCLLGLTALTFAACGGGGGGGNTGGGNSAPTANAGPAQTVFELVTVNLSGTGSDSDGDALTYTWSQVSGQSVTINSANMAAADFTAPDVGAGAPEVLRFQLSVNDGTTSTASNVDITVEENEPPVASAGPDANVVENQLITLDGSASSDPNSMDTITYAWSQIGGAAVGLTGDDTAQPTFTSPNVAPGNSEVLDFQLVVSDGVNNDTDTVQITVEEGQAMVTISGAVSFEFVPPVVSGTNCTMLDFNSIQVRPIRGATVQLIDAGNSSVLGTTTASATGDYSFSNIPSNTQVTLRVRAELIATGTPSYSFEVRDNIDTSASPPPLETRPLYAVERTFDSGNADKTENLTAQSGWGGSSYTGARSAAPFSVLDTLYDGLQLILSANPNAVLEPMDAFWNANNTLVAAGGTSDPDNGDIWPFYTGNPDGGARNPSLFLTGDPATDTDEFDTHVIAHEWGHYFEDTLSRSDSRGGSHALGQSLLPRVAFGEGWGHAVASIATGDPQSCDTRVVGDPNTGFGWSNESDGFGRQGWYNEISVSTFLYDLWDTDVDSTDNMSIGWPAIYNIMTGAQANTEAFTTIHSFAALLRPTLSPAEQTFLDSQLAREATIGGAALDIWGTNETNDATGGRDVLPIYTDLTADGSVLNLCMNSDYDTGSFRTGNKLAEHRFIRLTVPVTDTYDILMENPSPPAPTADPDDRDQSDPDVIVYSSGVIVALGQSGDDNVESFVSQNTLFAGQTYVVDVEDWRFADDSGAPATYPDQTCFNISFTATP